MQQLHSKPLPKNGTITSTQTHFLNLTLLKTLPAGVLRSSDVAFLRRNIRDRESVGGGGGRGCSAAGRPDRVSARRAAAVPVAAAGDARREARARETRAVFGAWAEPRQ